MNDEYEASIIMNTYNENYIYFKKAVDGYLNQNNVKIHLIISTVENDPSINIINNEYKDHDITLAIVLKRNHPGRGERGIYFQLNNATKYIKYKWYAYASSNDVPSPYKIYNEISICLRNNKKVCYSAYNITDAKLHIKKTVRFKPYNYKRHLLRNFTNDCSLIRSDILKNVLPFRVKYGNYAYWDLLLRIYEKYGNVFINNNIPTFYYRVNNNSLHVSVKKNKLKMMQRVRDKKRMLDDHKNRLRKKL